MANPAESSSSKSTPKQSAKNGKEPTKRRNRRRPRNSNNPNETPGSNEAHQSSATPLLHFQIEPVKQQTATVYRQRGEGPIKIQTFQRDNHTPCVFHTVNKPNSVTKLIQKLSIAPTPTASPREKPKRRKRNEKVPKTGESFNLYVEDDKVKEGLEKGEYIKGFIRINPKNCKESYIGHVDKSKHDYVIKSVMDRNRALDGDEVVIQLKSATEATVISITKKVHPRTTIGTLEPASQSKDYAVLTPRDNRFPSMRIPKQFWPTGYLINPKQYLNILLLAQLTDWKEEFFAEGIILETIGVSGDLRIESLAILREFCLDPTPYGPEIRPFLPDQSEIPITELAYREDLRKECIFTIDPITARDLDDALSCKPLPNGNYEVGVHISDAAHFLEEGTILDDMVKQRATTIYMVDTAYHMLPVEMCMGCSLLPNKDKLAFSVFWELTPEAEIVKERMVKSVINSCAQLAYEHAQMMIDAPESELEDLPVIGHGYSGRDLSIVVNNLQKLAQCLREKRFRNGALRIDQVKIGFALDPATGKPERFSVYPSLEAHKLIEDFMLLANASVGKRIYESYPDLAFLRCHESPKEPMMVELQRILESAGIHIDISTSGSIQASLLKYTTGEGYLMRARMAVLNHLLAKPMQRARYFCTGAQFEDCSFDHYALSLPIYTHFTSPIRRYADIMVHRLLSASLGYSPAPQWSIDEVAAIADNCNRQKYQAKRAGEASSDLYLAHFVEANGNAYVANAVVVDARERSIDVILLETGNVIRIQVKNFGPGVKWRAEAIKFEDQPKKEKEVPVRKIWRLHVTWPKARSQPEVVIVLEMFTIVQVKLSRKPKSHKLEGSLLRPIPGNVL